LVTIDNVKFEEIALSAAPAAVPWITLRHFKPA